MIVIKFLAILLLILVIIPKSLIIAQSNTNQLPIIQDESVNPGSPYYIFKRIKETVILNLTFGTKNKAKVSGELLDTRFRELAHAVKYDQIGYLENVSNRYTNQAGTIIEKYLNTDQETNNAFKKQAQKYLPLLESLRDHYHSNSAYWLMLQYAVDTTKRIAGS